MNRTERNSYHLAISEAEQNAIVNALAFYAQHHTNHPAMDEDYREQYRAAFREDNGSAMPDGRIDQLTHRIATL